MNNNDDATTEFYNDLVLATAVRLIKEYGSTTTLDIKNELRSRHTTIDVGPITFRPNFTQNIVSDAMMILEGLNFFTYTDNGTYRTYKLNVPDFVEEEEDKKEEVYISEVDCINLLNNLKKNKDITITFSKRDNSIRTIVGTVYTPNIGLGTMLVYDMELPDGLEGSNIRIVDLRRLISFELGGITYILDKNIK